MKLHIHFGIHRTGTTSIHHRLYANRERLSDFGCYYPDLGVGCRHVKIAWQLLSGKMTVKEVADRIEAESPDENHMAIISSEDFCQLKNPAWLKYFSEHFELQGSIYLKRQDLWLESWYNQHIKWPWSKKFSQSTPEFFIENADDFYWIDYQNTIETIAQFVPIQNLHIGILERGAVEDTASDLFKFLDIELPQSKPEDVKNSSLTKAQLDIARHLDLMSMKPGERQEFIKALRELNISEDDGSKTIFSQKQRYDLLSKYEGSNKALSNILAKKHLFDFQVSSGEPVSLSEEKILHKYIPQLISQLAAR
ncbi:hypothetical protein F0A16_06550 [Salinicola corii]|uniref:Sulfotransferase family protein n=1 Tax=Salinicola corii TaxID=2606937 RepID=A0A640WFG6_9GAMM|nr:hypothetical protein [Salinicola corii]KAA0019011.1 hypothetical protein F0A16_06550 [Salinicola corii]